jgi:hypothetical protein
VGWVSRLKKRKERLRRKFLLISSGTEFLETMTAEMYLGVLSLLSCHFPLLFPTLQGKSVSHT